MWGNFLRFFGASFKVLLLWYRSMDVDASDTFGNCNCLDPCTSAYFCESRGGNLFRGYRGLFVTVAGAISWGFRVVVVVYCFIGTFLLAGALG